MGAVAKESEIMQIGKLEQSEGNTYLVAFKAACYCWGGQGHFASTCRFCNTKCHCCQKLGHLAQVCQAKQKAERANKLSKPGKASSKLHKLAPSPRNKQELQSFLGMITYNSKFIPALSHTLHPLHQLLHKNSLWVWKATIQSWTYPVDWKSLCRLFVQTT